MRPRSRPPSIPPTQGGHQIPMTISATVFSKTAPAKPPAAGGAGHRRGSRPPPEAAHAPHRRSPHRRNRLDVPHRTEMNPRGEPIRDGPQKITSEPEIPRGQIVAKYRTEAARISNDRSIRRTEPRSPSRTVVGADYARQPISVDLYPCGQDRLEIRQSRWITQPALLGWLERGGEDLEVMVVGVPVADRGRPVQRVGVLRVG